MIAISDEEKHVTLKSPSKARNAVRTVGFVTHIEESIRVDEVGNHTPYTTEDASARPPLFIGDMEKERKWIKSHIQMKVCCATKPHPDKEGFCACGRKLQKEHTRGIGVLDNDRDWSADSDDCVEHVPTTAYGEMEFPNANVAKYVRVADDTDMDDMMYLVTKIWGLKKPNLLISVTGGAKNIVMSKRLKEAFKKGLLKTAQTTGAWIVSGGNNHGVMKYVGEAVSMLKSSAKVVAFGIAPWGTVMNKKELTSKHGCWPACYSLREETDKNVNLDTNHTHYILVDNGTFREFGTEIRFRGVFEKFVSMMRTGDEGDSTSTHIPVVSIVVEGGPGTLTTVKAAIENATPVVVLEGSGRAADMLAFAYNNSTEEEIISYDNTGKRTTEKIPKISDEVKQKLTSMVTNAWKNHRSPEKLVNMIIHCVMQRHLMVVFSLEDNKSLRDIDVAILHAIMKANTNDSMNQLKLALAWNRIDIVREEIFTDDKTWNGKELEDMLLTALIQNKADFVELLMDQIRLGSFLTKSRLLALYNKTPKNHLLYKLLLSKKEKGQMAIGLIEVGLVIQSLVGDFYNPLYLRDSRYNQLDVNSLLGIRPKSVRGRRSLKTRRSTFAQERDSDASSDDEPIVPNETAAQASNVGTAVRLSHVDTSKTKSQVAPVEISTRNNYKVRLDFEWPARELFLWSVLMRRKHLAALFLEEEKFALAPALLASVLLRGMVRSETLDAEMAKEIETLAVYFETIALGILNECFLVDEARAKTLLIGVLSSYGETTPLQLAIVAENKAFISHQCCQNLLNNIWWGKLDELQGKWRIFLSMACPPLLYVFIKFKDQIEIAATKSKPRWKISEKQKLMAMRETVMLDERNGRKSHADPEEQGVDVFVEDSDQSGLNRMQKFVHFFNAPVVTFGYNTVFYIAFLLLFAYLMLAEYSPEKGNSFTPIEIVLCGWVATLFIEELRQFWLAKPTVSLGQHKISRSLRHRCMNFFKTSWSHTYNYLHDIWNMLDVLTIILFVIGICLKLGDDHETVIRKATEEQAQKRQELSADDYAKWYYFHSNDAIDSINERHSYSRIVLCLALMMFIFRILHVYFVARSLGPKLVMIGKMMKDLIAFAVILTVFVIAFGIAQQAILYPNQPISLDLVISLVRKSYWQMYGELFLEDIEGDNPCTDDKSCLAVADFLSVYGLARFCQDGSAPIDQYGTCADNSTLGCYGGSKSIPEDLPTTAFPDNHMYFCYNSSQTIPECQYDLPLCPRTHTATLILLGVYILFTQILMFNLLIAMFSYTFQLVQDQTDMHWMYQRYSLINEYYTRPPVPPPFIVLNHIGLLIHWVVRKCRRDTEDKGDDFRLILDEQTKKQLADWERMNYYDYCRMRQNDDEATVEHQVSRSKAGVEMLTSNMEGMRSLPALNDRVILIEKRLHETSEALNWIMQALAKTSVDKSNPPPLLKTQDDNEEKERIQKQSEAVFNEWKAKKSGMVHSKARETPYIQASKINRFPVPNTKLYWEIPWSNYKPETYTAESVLSAVNEWADVDVLNMKEKGRKQTEIKFNQQDGEVDRRSFHSNYTIDNNGIPLNPFGRTGLAGRGLLGRWGPNHAIDVVITRWTDRIVKRKRVLEFIAVKRRDVEEWSIPGLMGISTSRDKTRELAFSVIRDKAFSDVPESQLQELLSLFDQHKLIFKGYTDDPRNTDNAWVETQAFNIHDEQGVTRHLQFKPGAIVSKVAWLDVSPDLVLFAGHELILDKLVGLHDCFYK